MRKNLSGVVLALAVLICCAPVSIASLRDPGPCYGFGCPALSSNNKVYEAKANKDRKAKDDVVTANKNAKPATDKQDSQKNAQ